MTNLFMESKHVKLDVYDSFKYTASEKTFENAKTVDYQNCTGFEVVTGDDAKELEAYTDGSGIDDLHEYLILYFEDGNTAIFRNSYVDLFALENTRR